MCGIICLLQYGKTIDVTTAKKCLKKLDPRGPDNQSHTTIRANDMVDLFMGFTRLAVMDTSNAGLQPFYDEKGNTIVCNGEIYNYKTSAKQYDIELKTECDCEILLPLFNKFGFEIMIRDELDAEFAMVIYDSQRQLLYAARDRYGIRPLYYGYNATTKTIGFASELKALHPIMEYVQQVKPNQMICIDLRKKPENMTECFCQTEYYSYKQLLPSTMLNSKHDIETRVNYLLTEAVRKRLFADIPIGFLLSGGLDSSLIVAIAARILNPENIVCFSIGLEGSPDVEAAKTVVKYLGIKQHHIVPFSVEEGLRVLPNVIESIETYDITTIRASTPQYLMAKYIKENTDIRVLLSGEGADEISAGYKYFRNAPDPAQLHQETIRLLEELYMFDNLRTDRTTAAHGLEVRCPYLDFDYVKFITEMNPELKIYQTDYIEKKIVRDSFIGYLPDDILYRPKEAFSDAVSSKDTNWYHSVAMEAEKMISNEELENNTFEINKPESKEALYYRKIFDSYYPNRDNVITHYWMPRFQNRKITDPSATILG